MVLSKGAAVASPYSYPLDGAVRAEVSVHLPDPMPCVSAQ